MAYGLVVEIGEGARGKGSPVSEVDLDSSVGAGRDDIVNEWEKWMDGVVKVELGEKCFVVDMRINEEGGG